MQETCAGCTNGTTLQGNRCIWCGGTGKVEPKMPATPGPRYVTWRDGHDRVVKGLLCANAIEALDAMHAGERTGFFTHYTRVPEPDVAYVHWITPRPISQEVA